MNYWNAQTEGYVYILHFDRKIGNMSNSRAQAQHYVGFSDDIEERLEKHFALRGAKIVADALKSGARISTHVYPATLAVEKLVKATKKTSLYCPDCCAAAHRAPRPLPVAPVEQLTIDFDDDFAAALAASTSSTKLDFVEYAALRRWRALRTEIVRSSSSALDDDLL